MTRKKDTSSSPEKRVSFPGQDSHIDVLLPQMDKIVEMGAHTKLKWTCPKCGDRCVSDEPDTFHSGGYVHTERDNGEACGAIYKGPWFGFMLFGDVDAVQNVLEWKMREWQVDSSRSKP